jgi:hypothetical protein
LGQCACTATGTGKDIDPCARNTFLLTKFVPEKLDVSTTIYDDAVVHFGQKLHIIAHPSVQKLPIDSAGGPKPLRMFSKQISTTHYSKYTRQQVRILARIAVHLVYSTSPRKLLMPGTLANLGGVVYSNGLNLNSKYIERTNHALAKAAANTVTFLKAPSIVFAQMAS